MELKSLRRRSGKIICVIAIIGILAGCNTQNRTDGAVGAAQNTVQGTTQSSIQNNVQAGSNNEVKPASETTAAAPKIVEFPDIERKPRVIDSKCGVYYEIFVRSFADSNNDGIGDIKGLISKLDYINDGNRATTTDLGADGIWLMPVNASPSYHKYDVADYYVIDPQYGTIDDFKLFLKEAHKRGIKVIMDLVVNHTSTQHPWFKEASKSEDSPFRDYYRWAKEGQQGVNLNAVSSWGGKVWRKSGNSYYYGIFSEQMPDLNYDNQKVRDEIKKIAKFWMDNGIDGFRLDAAMHIYGASENPPGANLPEKNKQWWKEFGAAVEEINPNVYLAAEVWDKAPTIAPYYSGLDSLFNFDLGDGIISVINSGTASAVGSKGFAAWLEEKYKCYAGVEKNFLDAPFLSNHDQNRSMSRLGNDTGKAKMAADIYLTLPGNPFIYYGEEIGMLGTKPDERIREPLKWYSEQKQPQTNWEPSLSNKNTVSVEEQQKDPESLLNHYKKMIKLRHSSEALMKGGFKALKSGSGKVVAYQRTSSKNEKIQDSVIVLHNLDIEKQVITINDVKLSNAKIIYESTGNRKNKMKGSEISIAPKTTVIVQIKQ